MQIATKVIVILPNVLFFSLHNAVVLIAADLATALVDHDLIAANLIWILIDVVVSQ